MSTLIIVESPAKAKKIKTFYKNDDKIVVKASYGHICDLDKKKLSSKLSGPANPVAS